MAPGSRSWARLSPLVVTLGLAGLLACDRESAAPPAEDTAGASADAQAAQLELLRALPYVAWDEDADTTKRGPSVHQGELIAPGYNLYTNDRARVYLSDQNDRLVHQWRLPADKRWCEYAELLPNGDVAVVCVGQSLTVVDWASEIVVDVPLLAHHDVHVLADRTMLVPYRETREYRGRDVVFDGIAVLAADGALLDRWSTYADLERLRRLHAPSLLDRPPDPSVESSAEEYDYYHLNTIEALPDTPLGRQDARFRSGNWLVCLRNVNVIAVLDQDRRVTWSWGEGVLDLPHMPTMLPNGNILVFDNGTKRGFSRVLEIDPVSERIVWSYQGDPPESFFSEWRGSSQRLDNGNTLICESERGHAFEVTTDGVVVWEFWNPELKADRRRRIYRFLRVAPDAVPRLASP